MKTLLYIFIGFCFLATRLDAQVEPKREMRATWVASVANIDWPKYEHRGKPEEQKEELIRMLDLYQSVHLNAIFLQVRPECDALYNSSYEPWSRYLTWTQGTDPGYDPLAFAIEEAHKRGIEVHAWLNPYRINASTADGGDYYAEGHVYLEHPEWALEYPDGKKILNPGIPDVMSYIGKIAGDIAANYFVDGIHFDDYFYSYSGTDPSLDAEEYQLYGGGLSLGDWRRQNINRMIDTVYSVIQKTNSEIRFGVSPFGIYKNGVPNGIIGLDAYSQIYCDPLAWLEAGSLDYLTPQQYWPTGGAQDFETLTEWWSDTISAYNRHYYPGQGTYRLPDSPGAKKSLQPGDDLHEMKKYFDISGSKKSEADNLSPLEEDIIRSTSDPKAEWTLGQIGLQIDIIRSHRDQNALGSVFFSAKDFDRVSGLADYLSDHKYTHPALVPEMTWKSGTAPVAPTNIRTELIDNEYYLFWDFSSEENDRFAIYTTTESIEPSEVISEASNLREITFNTQFPLRELDFSTGSNIVITAVSPTGKESAPSAMFEPDIYLPQVELASPAEEDTISYMDYLSWKPDSAGSYFNVQISTNISFSNVIYDSPWISDTFLNLIHTGLKGERKYYWRVKARREMEGPYTPGRIFYTGFPDKPELISPANLEQKVSTQALVEWAVSPVTDSVHVVISKSALFDVIYVNETLDADPGKSRISSILDKDSWYYVKIRGLNDFGYSEYTSFHTFRTAAGEIPDVYLLLPEDGADVASYDYFEWETSATTGNITYWLEVALDRNFTSIISFTEWVEEDKIRVENMNLEGNRTYYWRVKAQSEFGEGEYSTIRSFTTVYPTRPSIVSPRHLSDNISVMPLIAWTADVATDSIVAEFSQDSDFSTIEYSENFDVSESPIQINHSLKAYTSYYMRIKAKNEYGYSIYSGKKYFETGESNIINENSGNIALARLYPNPYKEGPLMLKLHLNETFSMDLSIFDVSGRKIKSILNGEIREPGTHVIQLEEYIKNLHPGYYYFSIKADNETKTLGLIKVKK